MRTPARFLSARDGIAAVEFAFVLPILLVMFFSSYAVVQAVTLSRKVTIVTRSMADLTTQYATLSANDITTVLAASAQIVAPFDATPLSLRVTEITTDATGLLPTVTWSKTNPNSSFTPLAAGTPFLLPASMLKPNISYIYSEARYTYNPLTSIGVTAFPIADHIFMLPRLSSSIPFTN